jgi:Outer membrane protein beta-barrel domain
MSFKSVSRLITKSGLAIAFIAMSANISADSTHGKRYIGLNFGFYEQEFSGSSESASLTSIDGRMGGYINDNAAVEVRLGAGILGDEIGTRDIDLNYQLGAYTRIGALFDNIYPYVLAGFTRAEVGLSNPNVDDSETDISYGLGIDMNVSNLTVNLEYAQLVDNGNVELGGFALGFTSSF